MISVVLRPEIRPSMVPLAMFFLSTFRHHCLLPIGLVYDESGEANSPRLSSIDMDRLKE
jgi:hypothetical protein